jgi:hypothetical protein
VPCEFGFLEDEDTFFASLADKVTRNKAKTDYLRRPSNEISQNEATPNMGTEDLDNDAIIEQSVEETLKESDSILPDENENTHDHEDNDLFFNQLKQQ